MKYEKYKYGKIWEFRRNYTILLWELQPLIFIVFYRYGQFPEMTK
jgi:hypothetical protein